MISKAYQQRNPQQNSKYFAQDIWGLIENGTFSYMPLEADLKKSIHRKGKRENGNKSQSYADLCLIF